MSNLSTTTALTPARVFVPSAQQQAFFTWIANGTGSAIMIAVAGAGKTTTLIEGMALMQGEVAYMAYNKKIATETAGKLQARGMKFPQFQATTVHAIGMSAMVYWAKPKDRKGYVGDNKVRNIIDAIARDEVGPRGDTRDSAIARFNGFVPKLVSLAKQAAIGFLRPASEVQAWADLVDHFGLEDDLDGSCAVERGIAYAQEVLRRSVAMDREVIDFDDMVYGPLVHNLRMFPKDWVLIDEAQDTNAARRCLAFKMLKPRTGRLVAVGDPCQAIYGFTGADSDSMGIIKRELGAVELPLTVTYRCPKAVVAHAQQWVSHIQAHETAPEGTVSEMLDTDLVAAAKAGKLSPEDVVLCRNNAPLVSLAFQLIRMGVPCQMEGRDIGKGLVKLCQKWRIKDLEPFERKLGSYLDDQRQKMLAKGKELVAAQLEDKVETIRVMIDKCREALYRSTRPGHRRPVCLVRHVNGHVRELRRRPVVANLGGVRELLYYGVC